MRTVVSLLAFVSIAAYADQQNTRPPAPGLKCLEVPPYVREAWHVKPTDCLYEVDVVDACDVTPPEVAKELHIDLSRCKNRRPKK